ncbi:hypothetical protein HY933_03195 [Candidatus Falkowbacteria bacterium]|nr:hypothetical protein [Candidatus Falkowbacteria bacterium]
MKKLLPILFIAPFILTGCLGIGQKNNTPEVAPVNEPPTAEEQQLQALLDTSYQPKNAATPLTNDTPYNIPETIRTAEDGQTNNDLISGEYCLESVSKIGLSYDQAENLALRGECATKGMLIARHFCDPEAGDWRIQLQVSDAAWRTSGHDKKTCDPYCVVDVKTGSSAIDWQCANTVGPYIVELEKIKKNPGDYDGQEVNTTGYCSYVECSGAGCVRDYQLYAKPLDGTATVNYMFHLKNVTACQAGQQYAVTGVISFGKMYTQDDDTMTIKTITPQ